MISKTSRTTTISNKNIRIRQFLSIGKLVLAVVGTILLLLADISNNTNDGKSGFSLLQGVDGASSSSSSSSESDAALSANVLAQYWIDAGDVLDHLDEYRTLWIKVHGCV
jgi:hypothetical protein